MSSKPAAASADGIGRHCQLPLLERRRGAALCRPAQGGGDGGGRGGGVEMGGGMGEGGMCLVGCWSDVAGCQPWGEKKGVALPLSLQVVPRISAWVRMAASPPARVLEQSGYSHLCLQARRGNLRTYSDAVNPFRPISAHTNRLRCGVSEIQGKKRNQFLEYEDT